MIAIPMETLTIIQVLVLLVLVVAESAVSYVYSLPIYNKRDTATSVVIGIFSIIVVLSTTGFFLGVLIYLNRYAWLDIEPGITSWIALFFICDFSYYIMHWLNHKVRFLWASHLVHHSSHELNYTTVLRGPVIYLSFRMVFWIPMVLIGFPPSMILVTDTIIQLYTVFTHTRTIGRLGILEWIFNTPAHHRLHHASNAEYMDKNFGGVLILWDRLFGTLAREVSSPVFGLNETRNMHNPIRLILFEWRAMARDLGNAQTLSGKFRAVFGKPGGSET
jgi:sterol desaturase/sphingolipid hydroxylase (fatty acid hydroxylase superfamily)